MHTELEDSFRVKVDKEDFSQIRRSEIIDASTVNESDLPAVLVGKVSSGVPFSGPSMIQFMFYITDNPNTNYHMDASEFLTKIEENKEAFRLTQTETE